MLEFKMLSPFTGLINVGMKCGLFVAHNISSINLVTYDIPLVKKVEKFFSEKELRFNKGSVAKRIRNTLSKYREISELPRKTLEFCKRQFEQTNLALKLNADNNQ